MPVLSRGTVAAGVPEGAYFVEPRVYGPVPRAATTWPPKEIFGPVLSVQRFDDEADAVALANDTEYGLMAAVWSLDGNRALRVSRGIRAGAGLHQQFRRRRRHRTALLAA